MANNTMGAGAAKLTMGIRNFNLQWSKVRKMGEDWFEPVLNPLNAELNPICHLLALLGA
jgi:hypothetical protein